MVLSQGHVLPVPPPTYQPRLPSLSLSQRARLGDAQLMTRPLPLTTALHPSASRLIAITMAKTEGRRTRVEVIVEGEEMVGPLSPVTSRGQVVRTTRQRAMA